MARPKVLWCGSRHGRDSALEFANRDLQLEIVEAEATDVQLRASRGIVYAFGNGTVRDVLRIAERTAKIAIDFGLRVFVLASDDEVQMHASREFLRLLSPTRGTTPDAELILEALERESDFHRRTGDAAAVPDHEIAQWMVAKNPLSAPRPNLIIEFDQDGSSVPELGATDTLLLQRAFADCTKLKIVELGGGKTAETFMVEATFADSRAGPRPLPFFAKLGSRKKITEEVDAYRHYATYHIPFHLRPNLDPARCISALERAILVGNFVERAEPLWDVAVKGTAHPAISSLFDSTLAGWRAQGFQAESRSRVSGSVASGLGQRIFDHEKVKPDHLAAAQERGMTGSPKELWESLLERHKQCYLRAPMHGDLHPGNVFVRGADAILIDLASIQWGPLAGDLACLEVAFLFEARLGDELLPDDAWIAAINEFYVSDAFLRLPAPQSGLDSWSARLNCARQVRMIALPTQLCDTEYMSAVAVYLLRRSMHPADDECDDLRRTNALRRSYALVIAERLVQHLESQRDDE